MNEFMISDLLDFFEDRTDLHSNDDYRSHRVHRDACEQFLCPDPHSDDEAWTDMILIRNTKLILPNRPRLQDYFFLKKDIWQRISEFEKDVEVVTSEPSEMRKWLEQLWRENSLNTHFGMKYTTLGGAFQKLQKPVKKTVNCFSEVEPEDPVPKRPRTNSPTLVHEDPPPSPRVD